jgi:inosine-uridine nucleoside N-ribohydrolase
MAHLHPESILEKTCCGVYVELQGTHSRGMLAVDHYDQKQRAHFQESGHGQVVIAKKIDRELTLQEIMKVLTRCASSNDD